MRQTAEPTWPYLKTFLISENILLKKPVVWLFVWTVTRGLRVFEPVVEFPLVEDELELEFEFD